MTSDPIVERRAVLRHRTQLRVVAMSVLLTLAGCMVGPNYKTPPIELPSHWSSLGEQGTTDGTRIDLAQWWRSFDDPLLNEVIAQALSSNLDEEDRSRVASTEERASLGHQLRRHRFQRSASTVRTLVSGTGQTTPFGEFRDS